MQAIATQNTRTPVSQIPGVGKKDALYLWHMYRLASGSIIGMYPIFNAIRGSIGSNGFIALPLTDRETSLVSDAGKVPLDQRWECFDLGVELVCAVTDGAYVPVSIADAAAAYDKLQLVFLRGGTQQIPLGPISLYPGGSGVTAANDAADAATTAAAYNGFPSLGGRRRLGRKIMLNPGDTWQMALEVANSDSQPLDLVADALDVRVSFWINRDLGLSG